MADPLVIALALVGFLLLMLGLGLVVTGWRLGRRPRRDGDDHRAL